jgi:outer membrane biosynthesis protein TonB
LTPALKGGSWKLGFAGGRRMRGSFLVLVLAAALVACSPKPPAAPAPPAQPAEPAQPSTPTQPEQPAVPEPPAAPEAPPPPAAPAPVRFSPSDYQAHERRIAALINNALSRDTTGETQHVAEQGHAEREHCTTKACIERSYAAEETWLRKWEGSNDIR